MSDALERIRARFESAGLTPLEISQRTYPDEVNYIVLVPADQVASGAEIGNDLDDELSTAELKAFVIVRKAPADYQYAEQDAPVRLGVHDDRATQLVRLISARSRVSLAQPSLAYVRDAQANLSAATAARNHLIFGRRGAGKTALLVEARRQVADEGAITCWVNVQTLRHEVPARALLFIMEGMLTSLVSNQRLVRSESVVASDLAALYDDVTRLVARSGADDAEVRSLVPRIQRAVLRFLEIEGRRFYIFVDDFYFLPRDEQPRILDLLHGCLRDADAWLKIASIKHLTRWFQTSPPLGLQTIHDAELIDLDVTLQEPRRAKEFLESVLTLYARRVGVSSLTRIFRGDALDRLVLASGAVPRDYLVLASSAILRAQRRQNAKLVGVQDVNQAAGNAAGAKLQELEDDMASNVGTADRTLAALKTVRDFCLEEAAYTYFLVSFREKEEAPAAYNLLTDLMDVRMLHLIDASVSDPHAAGHRYEAFMLDLSQFSGSRLKQRIHVLDFSSGRLVSRQTRTSSSTRKGDTPRQVIAILRVAPNFALSRLAALAAETRAV